jgi:hypothetical protein
MTDDLGLTLGEPATWYADPGLAVATVAIESTPTGIVASGGMLAPWPESIHDYMWDLWNRPSESEAMRQIVDSLEDGPLKARLFVEWANVLYSPDPLSIAESLPTFSASRGAIRYMTPTSLSVEPDGTIRGHVATWPKMSRLARLKHRGRRRWVALRLALGDRISGRTSDDDENEDW